MTGLYFLEGEVEA